MMLPQIFPFLKKELSSTEITRSYDASIAEIHLNQEGEQHAGIVCKWEKTRHSTSFETILLIADEVMEYATKQSNTRLHEAAFELKQSAKSFNVELVEYQTKIIDQLLTLGISSKN